MSESKCELLSVSALACESVHEYTLVPYCLWCIYLCQSISELMFRREVLSLCVSNYLWVRAYQCLCPLLMWLSVSELMHQCEYMSVCEYIIVPYYQCSVPFLPVNI